MRLALVSCALLAAATAAAETVHLHAGPPPAPVADWQPAGDGLAAPAHPLRPALAATPSGLALSVELPGAGALHFAPTGLSSRGVTARHALLEQGERTARSLPAGDARLVARELDGRPLAPGVAVATDTWLGVDEVIALRGDAVKHDLVVGAAAIAALRGGDLVATWQLSLPAGVAATLEGNGDVLLRNAAGAFLARLPAPDVADADDAHWSRNIARFELAGEPGAPVLALVVPASWARSPDRALPLKLDPTVSLQPTGNALTGYVDEEGTRSDGAIDSGSLLLAGFGGDVRGFAQFDTSGIPDGALIQDVRLLVWLSNHDNFGDAALPLDVEVKALPVPVTSPWALLYPEIAPQGSGRVYASERLGNTGPHFCPDSYVFRDYDLGALADADLDAQLPLDFFAVGFTSSVETSPDFDHIDYIGFPETVNNPFECVETDFPDTRITLVVEFNTPPACDAGGPYASDCPRQPFVLDGSGSADPDGAALTFAWTTTCPGFILDPSSPSTLLQLADACNAQCEVTLTVSDGSLSASCTQPVQAADTQAPVVVADNFRDECLWPPRHDFYCLSAPGSRIVATDNCNPSPDIRFLGCVSDQPDEAPEPGSPENGDGNFSDDCQVSADGQDICVRVERAGHDPVDGRNTFDGRHYTVLVAVDDGCGNVALVDGGVFVPHDRRGGSGGQDDPCRPGDRRKR